MGVMTHGVVRSSGQFFCAVRSLKGDSTKICEHTEPLGYLVDTFYSHQWGKESIAQTCIGEPWSPPYTSKNVKPLRAQLFFFEVFKTQRFLIPYGWSLAIYLTPFSPKWGNWERGGNKSHLTLPRRLPPRIEP